MGLVMMGCTAPDQAPPVPIASAVVGKPWSNLDPCTVTTDRKTEVLYRGPAESVGSLEALDDTVYLASDDGILRETGELFIPTSEPPYDLTASNGYLYWTQRTGDYSTLYASLGQFDTSRPIGRFPRINWLLQPARDGVTATPFVKNLTIWSALHPPQLVDNCPINGDNIVFDVATNEESLLWSNGSNYCAVTKNEPYPHTVELPDDASGVVLDEHHVYFEIPSTSTNPTRIYRRPINHGSAVIVASVPPEGSHFIVNSGSIFWHSRRGELGQIPARSEDDAGNEILACRAYSYAVSREYVYWTAPLEPINGSRTLYRMKR